MLGDDSVTCRRPQCRAQYAHLRRDHRERVENVTTVMFHERNWTVGNGFAITDEMRVVIAANAALMTLGLDEPYYFAAATPDLYAELQALAARAGL